MNWFEMKLQEMLDSIDGYTEFDSYEDYQAWVYWSRTWND